MCSFDQVSESLRHHDVDDEQFCRLPAEQAAVKRTREVAPLF
jgi:hypothetical protein